MSDRHLNDRPRSIDDPQALDRIQTGAMAVHDMLTARGCDNYEIVGVCAAVMHDALLQLPQHAARKTFSAMITTMMQELGFEKGRRETL